VVIPSSHVPRLDVQLPQSVTHVPSARRAQCWTCYPCSGSWIGGQRASTVTALDRDCVCCSKAQRYRSVAGAEDVEKSGRLLRSPPPLLAQLFIQERQCSSGRGSTTRSLRGRNSPQQRIHLHRFPWQVTDREGERVSAQRGCAHAHKCVRCARTQDTSKAVWKEPTRRLALRSQHT